MLYCSDTKSQVRWPVPACGTLLTNVSLRQNVLWPNYVIALIIILPERGKCVHSFSPAATMSLTKCQKVVAENRHFHFTIMQIEYYLV